MEKDIQRKILQYLRQVPQCYVIKVIVANHSGVPDILCCIKGDFVAFEVKADAGKKATPLQQHEMGKIWDALGQAYVVHDLAGVRALIEGAYGITVSLKVKP